MPDMTIGALAKASGVNVETVRYYQRRGLLAEPKRPAGGVRRYDASALACLRFIRRAQDLGFTLEEIQMLLKIGKTPNCRGARDIAARKLALVDSRLADLARMRAALDALVAQCDARGTRSCPIIESLAAGG